MKALPAALQAVIDTISQLPGLGAKSAERLVWYWLKVNPNSLDRLLLNLGRLKSEVRFCSRCYFFCQADQELCSICQDSSRQTDVICVVEDPFSVMKLEKSNCYHGLYHVLGGVINLPAGLTPDRLNLNSLIDRIKHEPIKEVILVFNSDWEGESTAIYLSQQIHSLRSIKVTRLAQGIPMGAGVWYLDDRTLKKAFENRVVLDQMEMNLS